jgi:CRP-like cAMP-binding protein
LLKNCFLTKNLSDSEIEKLAGAMKPQKFTKGELIIKYGDHGTLYYILSKGNVKVMVYNQGTDPNDPQISDKVAFSKNMPSGSGFGELALLYNDKRSASIEAVENCETWTLDGTVFKKIIVKSSMTKRNLQAGFLDEIKLFSK